MWHPNGNKWAGGVIVIKLTFLAGCDTRWRQSGNILTGGHCDYNNSLRMVWQPNDNMQASGDIVIILTVCVWCGTQVAINDLVVALWLY